MGMTSVSPIVMPKLGLTMTEGTVASWLVKPGDVVSPGDLLFVVETDKIATDIEARAGGKIEAIQVAEGETVPVGAVLATWTGPATRADDDAASLDGMLPQTDVERSNEARDRTMHNYRPALEVTERVVATPLARRLAKTHAIQLAHVTGSGPRGRVKSDDVLAYLADKNAPSSPQLFDQPSVSNHQARRPATGVEKTMARRLSAAKQEIPHFYVMAEADVSDLLDLRGRLNRDPHRSKISINHFVLLAAGRALLQQPNIAEIWDDGEIVSLVGADVGFAVDTPRGLFAPVLKDVGGMRIDAVVQLATELADRAMQGRLRTEDLSGGAITVSNVGMFGASWLVPIINPGQAAIIGVGAVKPQFRPGSNNEPTLRQILSLVLSADHRVLDGVRGAQYLNNLVGFLEEPVGLLR
jgi:pyruvate dehydrogenase E2 component (dihydrolipoamide acetyltransferase)